MKIKKGDNVVVISGDDKGARGTVHSAQPEDGKIVVSGVNIVKKHQRRTGNVRTQVGIIEREAPINVSKVAILCSHCDKATRIGYRVAADGSKTRICRKCGESID